MTYSGAVCRKLRHTPPLNRMLFDIPAASLPDNTGSQVSCWNSLPRSFGKATKIKLIDVLRTNRRWGVPKIMRIGSDAWKISAVKRSGVAFRTTLHTFSPCLQFLYAYAKTLDTANVSLYCVPVRATRQVLWVIRAAIKSEDKACRAGWMTVCWCKQLALN